jgi:hypothetical protein
MISFKAVKIIPDPDDQFKRCCGFASDTQLACQFVRIALMGRGCDEFGIAYG